MALNVGTQSSCHAGAISWQAKSASHGKAVLDLTNSRVTFLEGSSTRLLAGSPSSSRKNATGMVTAKASTSQEAFYTVREGDSLYRIAKQHDVTLSSLANENNIRIARRVPILPGQRLKIPAVKDRAILNEQEKIRMAAKLKRIAAKASSTEQLRASLIPKVPAEAQDASVRTTRHTASSVSVDTRPHPKSRSQNAGWQSFLQPAGVLLLIGAALFYFTKPKAPAKTEVPSQRKMSAVESSKLKLKPAPLPPSAPVPQSPIKAEAAVYTEVAPQIPSEETGSRLRYERVGNALFATASPRVVESYLSSSMQMPRVDGDPRPTFAPPQYGSDQAAARHVLEERLAAARAEALESHRRAELARQRAQQAEEAKEAVWGTVQRIRELSSINEEVLRVAEEALAEVTIQQRELAAQRR